MAGGKSKMNRGGNVMRLVAGFLLLTVGFASSWAHAQGTSPALPRTISDIAALLEQHKPDPARSEKMRSAVKAEPAPGLAGSALVTFYRERAAAAEELGLVTRALEDYRKLYELTKEDAGFGEYAGALAIAESRAGNAVTSLRIREEISKHRHSSGGSVISQHAVLAGAFARVGDVAAAKAQLVSAEQMYSNATRGPLSAGGNLARPIWQRLIEAGRADILEQEGKLAEADAAFRKAQVHQREVLNNAGARAAFSPYALDVARRTQDSLDERYTRNLILQGRVQEAELLAREFITRSVKRTGATSVQTGVGLITLAGVLLAQSRFLETQALAQLAYDNIIGAGAAPYSQYALRSGELVAGSLIAREEWSEAAKRIAVLREAALADPFAQRFTRGSPEWALALVKAGQPAEGAAIAESVLQEYVGNLGTEHYNTGEARGVLAMAHAALGDRERALAGFREAVNVLLDQGRRDTDAARHGLRRLKLRMILQGYIAILSETRSGEAAAEAFRIADGLRGGGVQEALAASAARASATQPGLADLVRRQQDGRQQITMLYDTLLRLAAAPPDQQLPKVMAEMRARVQELEKEQQGYDTEIARRFPEYSNLINPRPATVEQARAALRDGEALVSVLVADDRTHVWIVPKSGAVAFHTARMGTKEVGEIVHRLRRALDPGEVPLDRFPEFDVAGAHRLYAELLKPVEDAWKGAHTLMVVANGALAQLPFSVLVSEPVQLAADAGTRFQRYQAVPWLARRVGVTQLPSANTLAALRALPQANAARSPFIGYGDPQFGAVAHGRPQEVALRMRNLTVPRVEGTRSVDWIGYSQLSPLPDTRDEILAIAAALKADSQKDVFLGAQASKQNVMGQNLATRRILAFATHGLIPGDFPGLSQPALALAAPDGKAEAGLLVLEEILGLKLDADWVVLSACNTAAGDGAGAEAISGLGRGFFYAGSRALLVTHWPVETRSARQLVSTLFERYAADPKLSRAEALRQASLAVMEDTAKDAGGKALFSYAHPLFWAPYALVGDGGR
jgi:CHAT domain-containing protein